MNFHMTLSGKWTATSKCNEPLFVCHWSKHIANASMLNRLQISKELGSGEFGKVMKAEMVDGDYKKMVAVKMLKEGHSDDEVMNLVSEMEVMKHIGRHMNIINLIGCCTLNGESCNCSLCPDSAHIL